MSFPNGAPCGCRNVTDGIKPRGDGLKKAQPECCADCGVNRKDKEPQKKDIQSAGPNQISIIRITKEAKALTKVQERKKKTALGHGRIF